MRRLATGIIACGLLATAAFGVPLHPYVALALPGSLDPHLRSEPVTKIRAGSESIQLEVTAIKSLQARLGGTIQHGGDAADAANWLCFSGEVANAPVIFWFVSNDEMGHGAITQVAIQGNGGAASEGCGKAPSALTAIDFGVPSFGASQHEVIQFFGSGAVDNNGFVSYANEHPVKGKSPDCSRLQGVQYQIRNGWVNTISVSQVTSC